MIIRMLNRLLIKIFFIGVSIAAIGGCASRDSVFMIPVSSMQERSIAAFEEKYPGIPFDETIKSYGVPIDEGQAVFYDRRANRLVVINMNDSIDFIKSIRDSWKTEGAIIQEFERSDLPFPNKPRQE